MATHLHSAANHARRSTRARITGLPISDFSTHLLRELAAQARLQTVHVTSVHRSVKDQARIFFNKHVVEGKAANYKNPEVAKIVAHARTLHKEGQSQDRVQAFLIDAIEHVHGGPTTVSSHLGSGLFTEIFDVAHYSGPTKGTGRHNFMTGEQAKAFLAACRKKMPSIVSRLGHSAELGFVLPSEFRDEKCFHFEIKQMLYDKLELPSSTRIA
jgi:hypothetical protein